jgi:hypothetical protein
MQLTPPERARYIAESAVSTGVPLSPESILSPLWDRERVST